MVSTVYFRRLLHQSPSEYHSAIEGHHDSSYEELSIGISRIRPETSPADGSSGSRLRSAMRPWSSKSSKRVWIECDLMFTHTTYDTSYEFWRESKVQHHHPSPPLCVYESLRKSYTILFKGASLREYCHLVRAPVLNDGQCI